MITQLGVLDQVPPSFPGDNKLQSLTAPKVLTTNNIGQILDQVLLNGQILDQVNNS